MHKNPAQLRKQRNVELIRRMRAGETLNAFDSKASWYPPRPIIQKDPVAIARLYQQDKLDYTARRIKLYDDAG